MCRTFHWTMSNIDVLRKFDSFDHLVRWWNSCSEMFNVVWRSSKTSPNFSIVLNVRWNVVCVWRPCQTFRRTISFIFTSTHAYYRAFACLVMAQLGMSKFSMKCSMHLTTPRSNIEKFRLFHQLQCSVKCSTRLTGAVVVAVSSVQSKSEARYDNLC